MFVFLFFNNFVYILSTSLEDKKFRLKILLFNMKKTKDTHFTYF